MSDPVRKSVTVPLPPEAAFDLFTRTDRWWPAATPAPRLRRDAPDAAAPARDTLSPEAPVAVVSAWEPGQRLALRWSARPGDDSLVEVRFTPVDGGTRVDLTHSEGASLTAANLPARCQRRGAPRCPRPIGRAAA